MHGFEEKVREALEKEKFASQARRHVAQNDGEQVSLDGVLTAGVQELEEEMESGKTSPSPAVDAVVAVIEGEQEQDEKASLDSAEMHVPTALMKLRSPSTWTAAVQDLFSDKIVEMRKQDITIIALEGAATGAAIVTIIATLLLRPS